MENEFLKKLQWLGDSWNVHHKMQIYLQDTTMKFYKKVNVLK